MIELDYLDELVAELWLRERGARESASHLMRVLFREERLRPKQQKRVKELFHRMLSSQAMIDYALEAAAPGAIVEALQAPVRVLVSRVLSGDLSPKAARARLAWFDWERVAHVAAEIRCLDDPVRRLQLSGSIPEWLARRLVELLGAEAQPCLDALIGRAPVTLRANTLRCSRDELAARLAAEGIETRATRFATHGLEVLTPAQLFRTKAFHEGWFELQDEASQLVAEVVAPPPGGLVVDVCAGAGGKTLALAAALGNRGSVVALDVHAARLGELRRRARRAGAHNLRVFRTKADAWSEEVVELLRRADRVLVDAPCSGLGSLRRNPDMRRRISEEEIRRLRGIQLDLLTRTAALLRPHARVVYATCTFLPEENETVVAEVCQRDPQLDPVRVVELLGGERGRPVADADGVFLQTLPHRQGTDGFFAAVLRRHGNVHSTRPKTRATGTEP